MSSGKDTGYVLGQRAQEDMENIWRYTAENWSVTQADKYIRDLAATFELVTSMPMMARERTEFAPPVRIHLHERHLIIYRLVGGAVEVIRILGGQQDWAAILNDSDS